MNIQKLPLAVALLIAANLIVALSGCATRPGPVREVTVTRDVPMPVHQPCPRPESIPARPGRVAEAHPVMPTDPGERERILAAKLLEWMGYGEIADGIMVECSRPR